MASSVIKLSIAALLPVLLSVVVYLLSKPGRIMSRLPYYARQIIIGVAFGALAVVGTHWGIPMHGAMVNTRDAAVLAAGLLFGSPAGIIAGIIGGVERYIATVFWDIGSYTVIACSVSTFLAGIYSAALRRFMFDDKKPGWMISLAIGVIMEVFHLTMVFVTNINDAERAMNVVKACTVPMIVANGVSVMLSVVLVTIVSREKMQKHTHSNIARISQTIQRELLVTVTLTFVLTFLFIALFQTGSADNQVDSYLKMAIEETSKDISDTSDSNMLRIAGEAAVEYENGTSLETVTSKYKLAEAHFVDKTGIITDSSDEKYIGYDMASADQSAEFLVILEGKDEYVQPFREMGYDNSTLRKYAAVAVDGGLLQIGYDIEKFQSVIARSVVGITKNRHVGETGFIIVLDEKYQPVSVPEGFDMAELDAEGDTIEKSAGSETFRIKLGDKKVFARATKTEGYAIIPVFPESEAYSTRDTVMYLNSFIEILVFALMFAFIYLVVKHVVVDQIKKINRSLAKITQGNLDESVDVRSSEEFASLSDDINSTVTALKGYISEAERRIEAELEFAREIQLSSLPSVFPAYPYRTDFDIYASMDTAKEVGGDFYDFYLRDNDKSLCILIADVSGKGIPAAMFMMRAKSLLKSLTDSGLGVTEVFEQANNILCSGNDANMFVTAWEGIIDLESGRMTFVCAGHNPPAVRKKNGSFNFLRGRNGLVLAGMEGAPYRENEYVFEEGDEIFLYTDGVTEATNANKELFGENRLLLALNEAPDKSAKGLRDAVKAAVDEFVGDAPQFDDITMLSFTYKCPVKKTLHIENASLADIERVSEFIEETLEGTDCTPASQYSLSLAADEIMTNIVSYAYADKPGDIDVSLEVDETLRQAVMTIIDSGAEYNPLLKEDPDVTLSAEEREIGGLGIFLVKKSMDKVDYLRSGGRNHLILTKSFDSKKK